MEGLIFGILRYFTAHSLFWLVRGLAGFHYRESNNLFIIAKILTFLSLKALCIDLERDSCFSIYQIKYKKGRVTFGNKIRHLVTALFLFYARFNLNC